MEIELFYLDLESRELSNWETSSGISYLETWWLIRFRQKNKISLDYLDKVPIWTDLLAEAAGWVQISQLLPPGLLNPNSVKDNPCYRS